MCDWGWGLIIDTWERTWHPETDLCAPPPWEEIRHFRLVYLILGNSPPPYFRRKQILLHHHMLDNITREKFFPVQNMTISFCT